MAKIKLWPFDIWYEFNICKAVPLFVWFLCWYFCRWSTDLTLICGRNFGGILWGLYVGSQDFQLIYFDWLMHCHAEQNPHWFAKLKVERFSSNISIFSSNPLYPWGGHCVLSLKSVEGIKLVSFERDVDLLKSLLTHMFCHIIFNLTQICTLSGILVAV